MADEQRLNPIRELAIRAWSRERIRPQAIARGLDDVLAELDAARAHRAALEAEVERLRAALLAVKNWETYGGHPCWCTLPEDIQHGDACIQATDALAAPADTAAPVAGGDDGDGE